MGHIEIRRACPSCGHPAGWVRMWLKPYLWLSWDCPNCGARLEFDPKRRAAVALVSAILGIGPAVFCASRGWWWGATIAAAIWVYLWRYDAIRIHVEVQEAEVSTSSSANSSE